MRTDCHIDHIDPKWKEGRDYQLVCGLDVVYNMEERDPALNQSKSNQFLPWRWSRDEMGTIPVNQGDLCLFLDPDTNEWVLEEFMGPWWFEKSRRTSGRNNTTLTPEQKARRATFTGRTHSEETLQKMRGRRKPSGPMSEERKQSIRESLIGKEITWKEEISKGAFRRWAKVKCRRMAMTDPMMGDFED